MEEKILNELKAIVGEENVVKGTAGTQRFLRPGWETPSLVSVRPQNDEELQKIVDLARDNHIAIVTTNDHYLLEEDLDKEGIFLDFERMNEIEVIDDYTFQIDGSMRVEEANEELKLGLPEGDYKTVAGFILYLLQRIPKHGENLRYRDLKIIVTRMRGLKIEEVLVTKEKHAQENIEETQNAGN